MNFYSKSRRSGRLENEVSDSGKKQRDKITKDLKKLKRFESQIKTRIGSTKIKEWIFVTPEVNQNKLLEHVQKKQAEVVGWGLSIVSDDLMILIQDADFFATEINRFQLINGERLVFEEAIQSLSTHDQLGDLSEYEENINRKNKKRCGYDVSRNDDKLRKINELTSKY